MTKVVYEENLKEALTNLGKIEDELTKLNIQKDEIRDQIKKWMEINNLTEYESTDSENAKLWRLTKSTVSRRSVNYDLLQEHLDADAYNIVVSQSESNVFKCQPVKSRKKKNNIPDAPASNV